MLSVNEYKQKLTKKKLKQKLTKKKEKKSYLAPSGGQGIDA